MGIVIWRTDRPESDWIIPAEKFVVVGGEDDGKDAEIVSGVRRKTQRLMDLDAASDTAQVYWRTHTHSSTSTSTSTSTSVY